MTLLLSGQLSKKFLGGVFDTTSSNTGIKEGAVVYLEQMMDSKLWLACRHHIKHAYVNIMSATNSFLKALKSGSFHRDQCLGFQMTPHLESTTGERVMKGPYWKELVPETNSGLASVPSAERYIHSGRLQRDVRADESYSWG